MKSIGYEINKILAEKRLKQKDVAFKLDMTAVNLSKILKKKSIDAALLERIASVLDVPVSFFFDAAGEAPSKYEKIEKDGIIEKAEEGLGEYITKNGKNCGNCSRLEKIVEYQNRHIERLEKELDQKRKNNKSED